MSGSEELIGLEDRGAWESALQEVPHTFAHRWDHCHAIADSSGYTTYLYSFSSAGVRIVCPVSERPIGRYLDIVTPYGLSGFVGRGDCPSFASHWRAFAERAGYVCGYLILNPVITNETYFGRAAQEHRMLFLLDLQLEEEELFARLSAGRQQQIRRADEDQGALVDDRERLTDFFVRTYPDFMARRGAAGVYSLNERTLRELCESPASLLIGAERVGEVRAAALFGFTEHAADYVYNVSLPGEESYSAILVWTAVRRLKAQGIPTLNLGGGVVENDGIAAFKRRFGAYQVPLRNLTQVYRQDLYEELCKQAGVDPDSAAYFPAYRGPVAL